jgi:vitamin B12 transporter
MHRILLAALAALALCRSVVAESPSGTLSGTVHAPDGRPLPGLVLTLTGPSGPRTLVTGPEGHYHASALPAGSYTLAVPDAGFVLEPTPRVEVSADEAQLDVVLAPAPVREQVVVTATRGEAAASSLGISVTALDRERIEERHASSFLALVQEAPGVATARTGGLGAQGSMFVRGGESRYARILVDGVPINQPGGLFDFGSALPLELERVEVVRGATSSLYGTDALAGVVQIVTRRALAGAGPDLRLEGEGGTFSTWQARAASAGRAGAFDWNAGALRLETDNEVPNNAFSETAGAASLGGQLGEKTTLRLTLRAEGSDLGTPGQTSFGRPDLDASFERDDLVLGSQLRHARGRFAHQLQVGFAKTSQLSLDPLDSGCYTPQSGSATGAFPICDFTNTAGFQNDTRRLSFGYQLEAQVGSRHLVTAGVDLERETGALGSRSEDLLEPERTNGGFYVQDRAVLGRRWFVTAGGRVEHNGSFGWWVVPRAAVAFRLGEANPTTLKASGGAGIKEPTFFESFGVSFFAQGNPDLKPEQSRTFDFGVQQWLLSGRLRAEATYFHHDYREQIAFTTVDPVTFQGTYVNLGKTRAQGLEVAVEAVPSSKVSLLAAYTLLDGEVLVSSASFDPVYAAGQPLLRRPKHQGSVTARVGGPRLSGALTVVAVGRRADSDFVGLGLMSNPAYTRVDARLRGRIARQLEAFVVAENLFDEGYEEALGYPALGRSVRGGLRLLVGGVRRP